MTRHYFPPHYECCAQEVASWSECAYMAQAQGLVMYSRGSKSSDPWTHPVSTVSHKISISAPNFPQCYEMNVMPIHRGIFSPGLPPRTKAQPQDLEKTLQVWYLELLVASFYPRMWDIESESRNVDWGPWGLKFKSEALKGDLENIMKMLQSMKLPEAWTQSKALHAMN